MQKNDSIHDLVNNFTGGEKFFKQLIDAGVGNDAFIQEIVVMFVEESEETMKDLEAHVTANDLSGIKRSVHKLKSSFNMFELTEILELVRKLENLTEINVNESKGIYSALAQKTKTTFEIIKIKYL